MFFNYTIGEIDLVNNFFNSQRLDSGGHHIGLYLFVETKEKF